MCKTDNITVLMVLYSVMKEVRNKVNNYTNINVTTIWNRVIGQGLTEQEP